jgi:hypothetical protein
MNYYDAFAPQAWSEGGLTGLQAQVADLVAFNDSAGYGVIAQAFADQLTP